MKNRGASCVDWVRCVHHRFTLHMYYCFWMYLINFCYIYNSVIYVTSMVSCSGGGVPSCGDWERCVHYISFVTYVLLLCICLSTFCYIYNSVEYTHAVQTTTGCIHQKSEVNERVHPSFYVILLSPERGVCITVFFVTCVYFLCLCLMTFVTYITVLHL